jgi:hypothetical protein
VQRLALAMIATRGHGVAAQVEAVIEVIGPEQTIATMFLVGRYITHALIVNGLELTPPVPSIFEKAVE